MDINVRLEEKAELRRVRARCASMRQNRSGTDTDGAILVQQATRAAARAGLLAGDVILGIGGNRAESVDELRGAAQKRKENKSIALLVERNGAQIFVPVRVV